MPKDLGDGDVYYGSDGDHPAVSLEPPARNHREASHGLVTTDSSAEREAVDQDPWLAGLESFLTKVRQICRLGRGIGN